MDRIERPTKVARLGGGSVEYRFEPRGGDTVIVLHGGHLRAGLPLGERVFDELGLSVLVPSRPGYGMTPVSAGRTPRGFADLTAELCDHLGIDRVAAVVAMSAGGRTALAMAQHHPGLVPKLILEAAVGFEPWPERTVRASARIAFNPVCERSVWSLVRALMRRAPDTGLRAMMRSLSTLPPAEVVGELSEQERSTLIELFSSMRSGRGFINDLACSRWPMTAELSLPTLIVASATDGTVPMSQAEALARGIASSQLKLTPASSHFLWFGAGGAETDNVVREFLAATR